MSRPTYNPAIPDDVLAKQIAVFEAKGGKIKKARAGATAQVVSGESWRDQAQKNLARMRGNE